MTKHKHKPFKSRDIGYNGPVSWHNPNPAAHGNICRVDTCKCGMVRKSNLNGIHKEIGLWE